MKYRPRVEVFCFRGATVLSGVAKGGYVLFPGGGIDPKENAVEAAKREFAEEAGRRLINCTVAHPPSTQAWPKAYRESKGWKEGFEGGQTVWMTGSCSSEDLPSLHHKDYEPSLSWRQVDDVIVRLKKELDGGWASDVRVRLAILRAHQMMRLDRAPAKVGAFPVLSLR
jgi:8-oxo-dGTP pyrophosphatase MutT (NUDIX family)